MPKVCFYFQVHQPFRVKKYQIFDIGKNDDYFSDLSETSLNNIHVLKKVANKCYLPTNALLLKLLQTHPEFCVSFSITGVLLEQAQLYLPELIESFRKLVATGRVELLSETYYHSLSFLYSPSEFRRQVQLHRQKLQELFGVTPKVFRNTELIFNNGLAREVEDLGYQAILAEGADHILLGGSPNFVYSPKGTKKIILLLKNYKLSDDIAFRFSSRDWSEFPLTAPKFASWVSSINGNGEIINLFMDYETFGEHQWEDTGIFQFLEYLPGEILKHPDNTFITPTQASLQLSPIAELDVPNYVSWADTERDLSAWISNPMQKEALEKLFRLEQLLLELGDQKLIDDWRKLTTSDHFYYMCTKWFADGDVHKYFNPYESPYEAFISFMNVLADLKLRAENKLVAKQAKIDYLRKEFNGLRKLKKNYA